MNRQGFAISVVVGALALGIGTVSAFAAVPSPGADGKIRTCVKYEDINRYEQVRWITKTTCPKGEKLIAWNAKGPKGDKGATGDTGATGPAGAPGVNEAHFDGTDNAGHIVGNHFSGILDITVPVGQYAVTATVEVNNVYSEGFKGAACNINGVGTTLRDVKVAEHDTEVMTVIGTITTGSEGKIELVCGGTDDPSVVHAPEFDVPKIMAIRIS